MRTRYGCQKWFRVPRSKDGAAPTAGDAARGVPAARGRAGRRGVGADARRAGAVDAVQPLPATALPSERRGPQPVRAVAVLVHHQRGVPDGGRLHGGDRAVGPACVCCTRTGGRQSI